VKSPLHRIGIQNFKAFRDLNLNPEGRHLLVYGPNGSGKSSLCWAFYTFLQSGRKPPQHGIANYFYPADPKKVLSLDENDTFRSGEIALTLPGTAPRNETVFRSTGIKDDNIRGLGCVPTNVVIEAHSGWPGAFQTGDVSESADQSDPEDSQASLL